MDEKQARVDEVAHEIAKYLQSHPQAADSLEGIATWWMTRQRIRDEIAVVKAALSQLSEAGVVSIGSRTDRFNPVYRLKKTQGD